MLTISGILIHEFRTVVRKGLGVTRRQPGPKVQITSDQKALRLRVNTDDIAIELIQAGTFEPLDVTVPFSLIRDCGVRRRESAILETKDDQVEARWLDGAIPKSLSCPRLESEEFLTVPTQWSLNRPELLYALRDACESADKESSRYALSNLRLRGRDGQIAATDGRQLFAHAGFSFPWEEPLLVPASRVFTCSDLDSESAVEVGRIEDRIVLRTGPWTVWLKIDPHGRYPEIDSLIGRASTVGTTLELTDADAQFLQQSLKHLPGGNEFNAPITVDLNGAVTLRAIAPGAEKPTELVLSQSARKGAEVRFAMNRQFLARAAQLGFRRFLIDQPEAPVVARDGVRTMVWANLGKGTAIGPAADAIRVESPMNPQAVRVKERQRRSVSPPPTPPATDQTEVSSNGLPHLLATVGETVNQVSQQMTQLTRLLEVCRAQRDWSTTS